LRVAFAGTPPFAARALEAIADAGHEIPLVLTQPDRPAGRGLKLTASAVAQAALARGLRLAKPVSLRNPEATLLLRGANAEVLVVAAYGLILPAAILEAPVSGCINIHASLLPRWRGAAPIQRAILAGDAETGISVMRMEAGLDTGPVLLEKRVVIGPRDTTGTLTETLAGLGARAIVEALAHLHDLSARTQDDSLATYAAKISKPEARIDWRRPNIEVDRQVRAFDPVPGAEARLGDDIVKIWRAEPCDGSGAPGRILAAGADGVVIACGRGALRAQVLQRAGARKLPAAQFLQGRELAIGQHLD